MVIVDEVGKMELFSQSFISSVRELFSLQQATILATVPLTKQRPILFVDELKNRKDVTLIEVRPTQSNISFSIALPLFKVGLSVGQKKRKVPSASEGRAAKYKAWLRGPFVVIRWYNRNRTTKCLKRLQK